jgi:hypothetical protein
LQKNLLVRADIKLSRSGVKQKNPPFALKRPNSALFWVFAPNADRILAQNNGLEADLRGFKKTLDSPRGEVGEAEVSKSGA